MSSEPTDLMTILKKREVWPPMLLTLALGIQIVLTHAFLYKSENDKFYYSVHATQTTNQGLNLVDSSIPQFVPGLDAFALLDEKPSQRALMEPLALDATNPFLDHCSNGDSSKIENCKNNGTIPYMVMNKINGQSFYMTGRHNANILLTFLLWSLLGIVGGVLFFELLAISLKDWGLQKTDLSKLKNKLSMWTMWSLLLCVVYVLVAFIYSYSACPNCPDSDSRWVNNASTFYGLLAIVSIGISFYSSFATQKKAILFLKTNFKNANFSTDAMVSVERQPLIAASNLKQEILIPASMSAASVKSSSVKTSAIYDPLTKYDENISFTTDTFQKLPFTPTNTFILKAMIPLLFLWALFSKTQKSYGLDVDLQLYVVAMVCFAVNNYIFKKTLAFISYTFKWCHDTFTGDDIIGDFLTNNNGDETRTKFFIFNSTYFQIVLSSVLIQFLIAIVLCIYEGRFWVGTPIFSILWFILVYDFVSLAFLLIYRKDILNPDLADLLLWMFDTPFFAVCKCDSTPYTLYKPIAVVQFYGILAIMSGFIYDVFGKMTK